LQTPFAKSIPTVEKYEKLQDVVASGDRLAILINADPDALASSLALQRLFWRKTELMHIYCINRIDRADNLAFTRLLDISHRHVSQFKISAYDKLALVDSQPSHSPHFDRLNFDIIIDHHPVTDGLDAAFIDIKADYGANATLMTEYLKAAKIKPSPRLATALFYAIKTDTDNFVRPTVSPDVIAFRYLYEFVNLNIIKKIESSEITRATLAQYHKAMQRLTVVDRFAVTYMGAVKKPDILVQMADFFLKMAETTGSVAAGIHGGSLILVLRNADFKRNAGKIAQDLFGKHGSAGGHKDSARAEIPLENLNCGKRSDNGCRQYVLQQVRRISR
jgi:nanoRNase/pAp phosphatase (c-di-AMP/oligoRNAs hydrolase)